MTSRLVSGTRGRRRDHQLGHGVEIELAANGLRQAEHHDVVRRHQRGEGRTTFGQCPTMFGVKALARIDRVGAAAIAERAKEVQRIRVAHRHDQKRAVVAVQPEFDLRDHRQQHARCGGSAPRLWDCRWCPTCTSASKGPTKRHLRGLTRAAGGEEIFVVTVTRGARDGPEMDEAVRA